MPLRAPLDLLCYESKLSMVFALVGVVIKLLPGNGPYCFCIYGKIYHLVLPLYPNQGNRSGYE
jgi:hypothetical protein